LLTVELLPVTESIAEADHINQAGQGVILTINR
jgi:hypothetical protein